MKQGIWRLFALTLGLLLAFTVSGVRGEGISEPRSGLYGSERAVNEVSSAAAALAVGGSGLKVLDIATGEMTELTVADGEVIPWDEFFHRYWREILESPDFYEESELDELFAEMFIVQLRLEDAGGNVLEEIDMFEPTGYGDPVSAYGWDEQYRNVATKGYDSVHVDEYYVSYDGVVAVGPAQINSDIYVCDGPLSAESGADGDVEVKDGGSLELSGDERYQLNRFLSDFAETEFCVSWIWDEESRQYVREVSNFSSGDYDAGTLVDFAWKHIRLENVRACQLDAIPSQRIGDNYYDIYPLETINEVLNRCLGIQLTEAEIPGGGFEDYANNGRIVQDGNVYMPSGDGASSWQLALARDVSLIDDAQLRLSFDVYEINDQDIAPVGDVIRDDSVYYVTAEDAQNRAAFVYDYSGSAVINFDGDLSDRNNFTLREYTLDVASDSGESMAETSGSDESVVTPSDETSDPAGSVAQPSAESAGEAAPGLFSGIPSKYTFSSGTGGWWTEITIESDGSFSGLFTDINAGESGPGYDITEYRSEFSGEFVNPRRIDEYTWSFELGSLTYSTPVGESEIVPEPGSPGTDAMMIYADAYGIEGGKTFCLYKPGTPTAILPAGFTDWAYSIANGAELTGYGIYNVEGQYGFVALE